MKQRHTGQSLVEFALVVPLFLLLVFGLIDFSRLLFTYVSLSNGTREMARVAAVSTNWSSPTAVAAFNNYAMFGGGRDATTDSVTVVTGTAACGRTRDTGGTCSPAPPKVTCPMTSTPTANPPLSGCTLNQPSSGGFVEVQVTYTFQFNPLFQNRLAGVTDVWFMRPTAQVTSTSRAYVE
ncbi:MAG TPA: TadE/TadG family type IV pilus assembly protein [Chloroflexota bacterium]|nr:TadE/TadG family type IV pilus assembly protein [Chloroflexota bacterium]